MQSRWWDETGGALLKREVGTDTRVNDGVASASVFRVAERRQRLRGRRSVVRATTTGYIRCPRQVLGFIVLIVSSECKVFVLIALFLSVP